MNEETGKVLVVGNDRMRQAARLSSVLAAVGGVSINDLLDATCGPPLTPEERLRRIECRPLTNGVEPKQPEQETRQMRRARERKERKAARR